MNRRGGRGAGGAEGAGAASGHAGGGQWDLLGGGAAGRGWFHFHRRIIGKYENNILTR